MWCLCSDMVIPKHATSFYKVVVPSVSATSLPRQHRPNVSTNQQVGELGQTLITTLQSNQNPKSQQKQKTEGEEAQISGSDVLWALQRASACKKKKRNKEKEHGRGSTSVATRMEEQTALDYTNVRPLCINAHWGSKLDELEKSLRELSETT